MADPTKYTPAYSYSGFQAVNPSKPLPADEVDNDFANVSLSVNQTIDALKQVRRSDGKLVNQSVGPDQLSPALTIGFTFTGTWVDGRSYSAGDGVVKDDTFYSARVTHTADVSTAPGNDAYWNELFSLNDIVVTGGMSLPRDSFVGDGVTKDFTLSFVPLSKFNLFVQVGGVVQTTDGYSSNGNTLTFISAPPLGYGIEVRGFATVSTLVTPEDGSVTTAKLADGAVTTPKLASGAVTEEKLSEGVVQKINDNVRIVADITALKALDTTKYDVAFVQQSGREGTFRWVAGDLSAFVTADTYEALYVKANAIAATSGAWVRQRETLEILADWAGVVNGDSSAAAANTLKLQSICDLAYKLGRSAVCLGVGTIFKDLNPVFVRGIRFYGMGLARWHHLHNGTFFEAPSQIALYDTGVTTKYLNLKGVSSMKASGARWANESATPGTVNNSFYELQTFSNGAGLLNLTCGIVVHSAEGEWYELTNFRIFPAHGGSDGLDGYNNWATATTADDWAQNGACHFGIWMDGTGWGHIHDVQAVGHFMRSGIFGSGIDSGFRGGDFVTWSNPYWTIIERCQIEGWHTTGIRSADKYKIRALTATTVSIPYADDNPFVGVTGLGFEILTSAFTGTAYTYTGVSMVNEGGEDRLKFTGVSPDPTASHAVGDYLAPDVVGGGTSHVMWRDCQLMSLKHPTGRLCNDVALTHALPSPGTLFEASGLALVENTVENCAFQSPEEGSFHLHEAQDVTFRNCWFERGTSVTFPSGHRTYRPLAAPTDTINPNVPAGHGAGRTYNVRIDSMNLQPSQWMDLRPYYHTQSVGEFTNVSDTGKFMPAWGIVTSVAFESSPSVFGHLVRAPKNGRAGFAAATYDPATGTYGAVFWHADGTLGDNNVTNRGLVGNGNTWDLGAQASGYYQNVHSLNWNVPTGNGQMLTAGTVRCLFNGTTFRPNADNAMTLGVNGGRWSVVWAATGTISTSDERDKTFIGEIPGEWLDAWGDVQWRRYKWVDAVAGKGEEGARWHLGAIAQQVEKAFADRGLNAFALGLLCFDEWEDEFEDVLEEYWENVLQEDGRLVETRFFRPTGEKRLARPGGNRYGLRYEQCLVIEAAYQRRRLDRVEAALGISP